ncbi:unnamed protein product, partial [Chrysoparadoxa australica]
SQGSRPDSPRQVLLYVPNIIGYIRIGLLGAFVHLALNNWVVALACYGASFTMDALDGAAARWLQQTSKLGIVLDMVTDRCGTAALLVILALVYPEHLRAIISLLLLDVGSHWMHTYW